MGHDLKHCHCNKDRRSKKKRPNMGKQVVAQISDVLSDQYANGVLQGVTAPVPDCIVATGPKSVIAMTNVAVAIYAKDTMKEIYLGTVMNFYGSTVSARGVDSYIVYDELNQRFAVVCFGTARPTLVVSISKDSNPQSGDDFYHYLYKSTTPDLFPDFPHLAVDREALYITTREFKGTQILENDKIRAFAIEPLLNGNNGIIDIFTIYEEAFVSGVLDKEEYIFPLQPRKSQSGVEKVLLVSAINIDSFSGDGIRVYQIENVLSGNGVAVTADVKVPIFQGPEASLITVDQPPPLNTPINSTGNPIVILPLDAGRFPNIYSGVVADNSVWCCHPVFSNDGLDLSLIHI